MAQLQLRWAVVGILACMIVLNVLLFTQYNCFTPHHHQSTTELYVVETDPLTKEKKTVFLGERKRECSDPEDECNLNQMTPCQFKVDVRTEIKTEEKVVSPSQITCSDNIPGRDTFCKYENVCLMSSGKEALHWFSKEREGSTIGPRKRDTRMSQTYWLKYHHMDEFPDMKVKYAKGTYIWADPRYTNFHRQPGHFFETGFKINELRKRFPGKIEGMLLVPKSDNPTVINLLDYVCQTLRVSFEPEGFELPPVYYIDDIFPTEGALCFESILVPRITNLYFSSRRQADEFRDAALHMCGVEERSPTEALNVFRMARNGRRLKNWPELCELPEMKKYNVETHCFDSLPFCDQVKAIYWGDIIVASHGSGLAMNAFARRGSVVMDIIPYKFRNPDLKLIAYYAGLRYLEFVNRNDSLTGELLDHKTWKQTDNCHTMSIMEVKNANWWDCFHWYQDCDHIWHADNYRAYLKEAERIWNRPNEFSTCEIPGYPMQDPYWISEMEGNWMVCEPPGVDYCTQDPQCFVSPDGRKTIPIEPFLVQQDYDRIEH